MRCSIIFLSISIFSPSRISSIFLCRLRERSLTILGSRSKMELILTILKFITLDWSFPDTLFMADATFLALSHHAGSAFFSKLPSMRRFRVFLAMVSSDTRFINASIFSGATRISRPRISSERVSVSKGASPVSTSGRSIPEIRHSISSIFARRKVASFFVTTRAPETFSLITLQRAAIFGKPA